MKKQSIPEIFGEMVFDDRVMKSKLSADVYKSLKTEEKWKSIYSYMIECCGQELDFHFKYLD